MNDNEKRDIRIRFLKYVNKRFHSLPVSCPEEGIWSDGAARDLLKMTGKAQEPAPSSSDFKVRFDQLTRIVRSVNTAPSSNEILGIQDIFITRFCEEKNEDFLAICKMLEDVANR